MSRFLQIARSFSPLPVIVGVLLVQIHPDCLGQTEQSPNASTLNGIVRDSQNHPVAAATVRLRANDEDEAITVRTDANGFYSFSFLRPGTYTVTAGLVGTGETTVDSVLIRPNESKRIDLKLGPPKAGGSPEAPAFFDEPQFSVAGVADTTSLGGHGSDTVIRNKETLANDTASLSKDSQVRSAPGAASIQTEKSLRENVERDPASFAANYRLGKFLVDQVKPADAVAYLEAAFRKNPNDYDNTYELALAYVGHGDFPQARARVLALLTAQDKAELHHLLAEIDERENNPLAAVREYERAAKLNPSEPYWFDWGSELLIHRAPEPAIEVFTKGSQLFPSSIRMRIGLGVAYYAQGSGDQAVALLCEASDLDPADPNPYLFLGKIQSSDKTPPPETLVEKLARFAKLHPEDALANHYYAVGLWKSRGANDASQAAKVQALLENAVRLNPKLGLAHLQLGILYSERGDSFRAISAYQRAIDANPDLEEAHYRLAQIYRQTGEPDKAKRELRLYQQIANQHAQEVEQRRHVIQQFVYTLRDPDSGAQPK